jgi:integrase
MANSIGPQANVIEFPQSKKRIEKSRKTGINVNKEGSVRNVNGKVYVDFIYLGERIRESSGLDWNETNAKSVREQLDKIIVEIKAGIFKFAKVFPKSKKADYFTEKELCLFGEIKTPDQVPFKAYAWDWYELLKDSGRVSQRTLWGYKSYLDRYLTKYFEKLTFAELNKSIFDKFVSWAKKQRYRKKGISNETVNKIFVPLKMICKDAAIEYGWGSTYNPFYGFKRLPEDDAYEKIFPFSLDEQCGLIANLSGHWKPYFLFAFCSGVRQGEQIAIKPGDINWSKKTLQISRAITRDEDGKIMMGKTKNKYSRRTIKLLPIMRDALKLQKKVYDQFKGEYFFCSTRGKRINTSHLRQRVWQPALKKAGLDYREMKQTRHSFATNALISGENPLWIAKVMGHRDTDMIIRVYSKYIEDAGGQKDGNNFDAAYQGIMEKKKE